MEVTGDVQNKAQNSKLIENQFKADLAHYSGNWIWRAVECIIDAPDFEPSPKWAAKRLNTEIDKIVEAFDGLERLGYIKRDGPKFVKAVPTYNIGKDDLTREKLLAIHSVIAPQVISKLTPTSKFTTWFFLGDEELVAKYTPQFMNLYRQMHKEGLEKGLKGVIASEISFAVVSDGSSTGGQQ